MPKINKKEKPQKWTLEQENKLKNIFNNHLANETMPRTPGGMIIWQNLANEFNYGEAVKRTAEQCRKKAVKLKIHTPQKKVSLTEEEKNQIKLSKEQHNSWAFISKEITTKRNNDTNISRYYIKKAYTSSLDTQNDNSEKDSQILPPLSNSQNSIPFIDPIGSQNNNDFNDPEIIQYMKNFPINNQNINIETINPETSNILDFNLNDAFEVSEEEIHNDFANK